VRDTVFVAGRENIKIRCSDGSQRVPARPSGEDWRKAK